MKRSFWITLTISAVLCTIATMTLGARNKALTQRLAEAEGGGSAGTGIQPTAGTGRTGTATAESAAAERESAERVGRAVESVAGYVAGRKRTSEVLTVVRPGMEDFKMYMPKDDDPYSVRPVPELLRAVQNLSVDELIATIEEMPREEQPVSGAGWILLELAALQDPRAVYRNEQLMERMSELEKLGILARFDPAAALRQLPPLDSADREDGEAPGKEEMEARVRFATMLLGVDVDGGLQALLEARENGYSPDSFWSAEAAEQCIPELMEAIKEPKYAGLRERLITMTLNHTLIDSGMELVAERAQAMKLSQQELNAYIDSLMKADIMAAQPAAAIDWMAEVGSSHVPSAVVRWANLDLTAATDWLSAQDPSPLRDRALASFATEAAELDREGAAAWAREIEDEGLRAQTLQRVEQK